VHIELQFKAFVYIYKVVELNSYGISWPIIRQVIYRFVSLWHLYVEAGGVILLLRKRATPNDYPRAARLQDLPLNRYLGFALEFTFALALQIN
jgi:hypothetical protein